MKPVSLDIPNRSDDLADWLSGHLLSRNLAKLVAELAAIHADGTAETHTLEDVLGSERQAVLAEGLDVLPHPRLVQLLRRPTLLLDLQEVVLADGGTPWRLTDTIDDELQHRREAGWMRLRQEIDKQQWHTFTTREPPRPVVEPGKRPSPVAIILAVAVLALIGVIAWQFEFGPFEEPVEQETFGWNRPAFLVEETAPQEYLNRLADAADEWFDKRPLTRDRLAARILQFRQGCAVMRFRERNQLPPDDRQWLTDQFRDWAKSLDKKLTDLEEGDDVIEVRDAVDELTREIVAALRDRADK